MRVSSQQNYRKLNTFINSLEESILKAKKNGIESKQDVINVLSSIDRAIVDSLNRQSIQDQYFLSKAINKGVYDCDTLTTIYLSVAEVYGLPIKAVKIPGHIFIRWKFTDGKYLNWETRECKFKEDILYTFDECITLNNFEELSNEQFFRKYNRL